MDFSKLTIEEAREFLMYNGVNELSSDIFTVQKRARDVFTERNATGNVVYTLIFIALDRAARFPSNNKYTERQIIDMTLEDMQAFGTYYQFDWTAPYAKPLLWRILQLQNNVITEPVVQINSPTFVSTSVPVMVQTIGSADMELQNKVKNVFDKTDRSVLETFVKHNDKKNFINVDMGKLSDEYLTDKAVEIFMRKYKNDERIIDVGDWNIKSIIAALKYPSDVKYTDLQIDNLTNTQIDNFAEHYKFKRSSYDNNPKDSNTKEFIKSILSYQGNLIKTY